MRQGTVQSENQVEIAKTSPLGHIERPELIGTAESVGRISTQL